MSYNQLPPPPVNDPYSFPSPMPTSQGNPHPPPAVAQPGLPPVLQQRAKTARPKRFNISVGDEDELEPEDRAALLEMSKEEYIRHSYTAGLPQANWDPNRRELTIGFGSLERSDFFGVKPYIEAERSFATETGEWSALDVGGLDDVAAREIQVSWKGTICSLEGRGTFTFGSTREPRGFFTTGHRTEAEKINRQRNVLMNPAPPPPPPDPAAGPELSSNGRISATEGTELSIASNVPETTTGTQ